MAIDPVTAGLLAQGGMGLLSGLLGGRSQKRQDRQNDRRQAMGNLQQSLGGGNQRPVAGMGGSYCSSSWLEKAGRAAIYLSGYKASWVVPGLVRRRKQRRVAVGVVRAWAVAWKWATPTRPHSLRTRAYKGPD